MKRWPRWVKWTVATTTTLVAALLLSVLLIISTEAGARLIWKMAPPLAASAGVQLTGDLTDGSLVEGLRLQNLRVQQQGADGSSLTLQIRQLTSSWQLWQLFGGQLQVDRIAIQGVSGTYTPAENPPAPPPSEPLTHDNFRELLFGLPVSIELDAVSIANVDFNVGESNVGTDVLSFALSLDESALTLRDFTWGWQPHGLNGGLSLNSDFVLDGALNWRTAVDGLDYTGALTLGGSLDSVDLAHQLLAPQVVATTANIEPGIFAGQTLHFDLTNSADRIDLATWGVDGAAISQLRIDANGSLDLVTATASLVASYPDVPDTTANLQVRWQDGRVEVDGLKLDNPELELNVAGSLQPSPLEAEFTWSLDRLDPGERFPTVQLVDVTGNGAVQITDDAGEMVINASIARLGGILNDRPLAIDGDTTIRDALPEQLQLSARSGDNHIEITGGITEVLDLRWDLQAPQLSQLWTALGGTVTGEGVVSGTLEMPEVDGSIVARNIAVRLEDQRVSLAALTLNANHQNGENQLSVTAQQLSQNGETLLNDMNVRLQGTPEQHALNASLNTLYGALQVALEGSAVEGAWSGELQELQTRSDYGDWELREAVAISVGSEQQNVERLCLDFQNTALCAQVAGDAAAGLNAQAEITGLQLDWLNRNAPGKPVGLQALQDDNAANLPEGLSVEGTVDLNVALEGLREGVWRSLTAQVQPSGVVLQIQRDLEEEGDGLDRRRFRFDDVVLHATNANDTWQSQFGLSIADETTPALRGRLDANVALANNEQLSGTVDINFGDLSWVQTLAPIVRDTRGALRGTADIGGTLEQPEIVAVIGLSDGGLRVPDYGVDVTALNVEVRSTADNTITLRAEAFSGEGNMSLNAIVNQALSDERTMNAQLTGSRFRIVDMPGATAELSPDLRMTFANNALNLSGNAEVDSASIDLEQILGQVSGSAAVNVSPDVIVVRVEDTGADMTGATELALSINANLTIGEAVTVTGYGLDAQIDGDLNVEQEAGRPLLVYGELTVPEGSYEAYNQRLDIGEGRVMFFGNPANPVLDLRAKRETNRAEVGLRLTGSVSRMQGELYSVPTLPENEILALLVTGKSFNDVNSQDSDALLSSIANFGLERGQGLTNSIGNKLGLDSLAVSNDGGSLDNSALGLGKYITPKLLMQYKVGLFDRQAILSLNYTLTERLKLEVQSGVNQSVDVNYTVEKD